MRGSGVVQRPNGKYRARYYGANGREISKDFARRGDAVRWRAEQVAAVARGDWIDPRLAGRTTFAEWFEEWASRKVWTDGTLAAAQTAAKSVTFGHVALSKVRPSHVEQWIKVMTQPAPTRKRGLQPSTIKTRFSYVSMAFEGAVRDRMIPLNPCAGVRTPAPRRRDAAMKMPTAAEVGDVLRTLEGQPFHTFVALCAFAGLRLGEAAGVQVGDVDFLRRTLTVGRQIQGSSNSGTTVTLPKHGSERVIHLAPEVVEMLSEHIRNVGTWGDDRWLFGSSATTRLHRNSAGHLWRQAREAAELPAGYTLHGLRHFYASGLIADGCDVVTVQSALGHSSADITLKVYSHLWPKAEDKTRAAASSLVTAALAGRERTSESAPGADLGR